MIDHKNDPFHKENDFYQRSLVQKHTLKLSLLAVDISTSVYFSEIIAPFRPSDSETDNQLDLEFWSYEVKQKCSGEFQKHLKEENPRNTCKSTTSTTA